MLKIIGKLYIQNIPYALLLSVQLVIVSFIFDISFVMTAADRQVLRNVNIPEGEFYFATGKETEGVDIEKLSALLGEDKVGYIERNGNKSVGKADAIKSPGVVYLGGALSKISYELSAGTWFTGAEHEVILGGDIASDYKVGDTLVISEDDICETDMREENTAERKVEKENIKEAGAGEEAVVVGILKSPAREPNMDTTCIDNFSELLWEKERILLTNDEHLVQGAGSGYKVETGSCLLDLSEASDQTKVQIKKEYEICPVQKTLNHAKKEQNVRTMKETVRLSILLGIAFASVAIQVFLYVRKYKKELDIFRMLGMSWGSIYGMTLFGHICNICMGALGMYLLFQSKGILARFGFVPDAELMKTGWYATGIFFAVYLLVTALIFGWTVHEEERREIMLIELKQIMKTYDGGTGKKYPVLKGVDFQMQSGEMVSILGKSGSGKSTLLRILGLLERPDNGTYFFDGQDIRKQKRKWNQFRNKQIGFVMQDYALLERLSVFENIVAPMYIAHCSRQKIEGRVLSLVEKFQIGDLLDKAAYQLSGGEKQRVAIARAMVQKPKLLLADEPTGSLDDENAEIVLKTLKNIHQEGTGIILVTHDKRIAFSCDRVYRLQDGKLERKTK